MALRTRHGNAARFGTAPVLECLPVDELPVGVPDDARVESPTDRGDGGRFAPGNALARRGGKAKGGKSRLAQRLGLAADLPDDATFKRYRASAETFRRVTCASLASSVGGGYCGPIPSSMVGRAALALGWSHYYSDAAALAADQDAEAAAKMVDRATRLGESSSRLLREAHEYAAKEATARASRSGGDNAFPSDWTDAGEASS